MTLDKTLINVFKVSKMEKKNLTQQMVKLAEEHGELAAAVLMHLGQKGTRMSKNEVRENVLEEGCDCLLMVLSILNKAGFKENEINEMTKKKLKKWKDRLGK
jgi:NTP pyrophosphatase (non-canonical NTP hydrolase)